MTQLNRRYLSAATRFPGSFSANIKLPDSTGIYDPNTYGNEKFNNIARPVLMSDGSTVFAGDANFWSSTPAVYLMRLAPGGQSILWQKKIYRTSENYNDVGRGPMAVDKNDNIYVTFHLYPGQLWLAKFDKNGNKLAEKRLSNGVIDIKTMLIDSASNIILLGAQGTYNAMAAKFDSNLNLVWQKVFCGRSDLSQPMYCYDTLVDGVLSVDETYIYAVGTIYLGTDSGQGAFLRIRSSDGAIEASRIGYLSSYAYGIALGSDGLAYMMASQYYAYDSSYQYFLVRFDPKAALNANYIWSKTITNYANNLSIDPSNNVIYQAGSYYFMVNTSGVNYSSWRARATVNGGALTFYCTARDGAAYVAGVSSVDNSNASRTKTFVVAKMPSDGIPYGVDNGQVNTLDTNFAVLTLGNWSYNFGNPMSVYAVNLPFQYNTTYPLIATGTATATFANVAT